MTTAVGQWKADMRDYAFLPAEAQAALAVRAQQGDLAARDELVLTNWRLVLRVARNFATASRMAEEDLVQEAQIGLLHAITKFDPARKVSFSTYAMQWMRQALLRAIPTDRYTIRLPEHVYHAYRRVRRETLALQAAGEAVTLAALAARGVSARTLNDAQRYVPPTLSLDQPLDGDANAGQHDHYTLLASDAGDDPADSVTAQMLNGQLIEALATLTTREREILHWRYEVEMDGKPLGLLAIAEKMGLSRERTRQLHHAALNKLRAIYFGGKGYEPTASERRTSARPRREHPVGAGAAGA